MRILVLGGYGLIGAQVMRTLLAYGHDLVGAGRALVAARRRFPDIPWVEAELGRTDIATWTAHLQDVEVVVNAAGALQDGLRENLAAVHVSGLQILVAGCEAAGVRRLIHLSAAGVAPRRGGGFNETKAAGEAVVSGGGMEWVILRPGLVFGPGAFGGTAMLRGLAAFPGFVPVFAPQTMIQPVGLETIGEAVARAAEAQGLTGIALDLVGAEQLPLRDVVEGLREWLGLAPAPIVALPLAVVRLTARLADLLGWLGWRNAMRTNAVEQIVMGMASPGGGEAALGLRPQTFRQILRDMPSTLQERRFSRLYFAKPAALIALCLFCATTGAISFASYGASTQILVRAGLHPPLTDILVTGGALLDLALAIGLAVRAWASLALVALIVTSVGYLVLASLLRADLWLDPLGVLSKTLLVALLAAITLGMTDDR